MERKKGKATKERVVQTASELFKEKGYVNVTISDICEASGITKSTFYYHFKSKDAILEEYFTFPSAYVEANFNHLLISSDYVGQLWIFLMSAFWPAKDSEVELSRQLMISRLQTALPAGLDNTWETERLLIQKAQEAGQIQNTAPSAQVLECLLDAIAGARFFWCMKGGNYDIQSRFREIFRTILMINPEHGFLRSV